MQMRISVIYDMREKAEFDDFNGLFLGLANCNFLVHLKLKTTIRSDTTKRSHRFVYGLRWVRVHT
jgi:hypothetical protein